MPRAAVAPGGGAALPTIVRDGITQHADPAAGGDPAAGARALTWPGSLRAGPLVAAAAWPEAAPGDGLEDRLADLLERAASEAGVLLP